MNKSCFGRCIGYGLAEKRLFGLVLRGPAEDGLCWNGRELRGRVCRRALPPVECCEAQSTCPGQEVGFGPKSRGTDGKPTNEMGLYSRKTQNLTGSCNSPLFFSRIGSDSRLLRIAYGLLSVRVYKACPQASLDQSGEWKIAAARYQLIRAASTSIDATCVWSLTFFG